MNAFAKILKLSFKCPLKKNQFKISMSMNIENVLYHCAIINFLSPFKRIEDSDSWYWWLLQTTEPVWNRCSINTSNVSDVWLETSISCRPSPCPLYTCVFMSWIRVLLITTSPTPRKYVHYVHIYDRWGCAIHLINWEIYPALSSRMTISNTSSMSTSLTTHMSLQSLLSSSPRQW